MTTPSERPLVLHVVHSFAVGGLENGVVSLINRMSPDRWRHGVLALTAVSQSFRQRVQRNDVTYESLDKPPGHLVKLYPRVFALLRRLRPSVVHTNNLAALEAQVPAWAAGVAVRIHAEHGWDMNDLSGGSRRYRLMRRLYLPFVQQYVPVSVHLRNYLIERVGVPERKVEHVCNGVDTARFFPSARGRAAIPGCPFVSPDLWLVGTVGRLQGVKDQTNLAHAFVHALRICPEACDRMRLVIAGDGPLRERVLEILRSAGAEHLAWLPGERDDVPEILRGLDLFALPSLAEGISYTVLEAMSSALPVVATAVGGNAELVEDGLTGTLVPAADSRRLGEAILAYYRDPALVRRHGRAGRQRVEQRFSVDEMVTRYEALYERLLRAHHQALMPSTVT